MKRRRRVQMDHWREVKRQTEPISPPDGAILRLFKAVFKAIFRIR